MRIGFETLRPMYVKSKKKTGRKGDGQERNDEREADTTDNRESGYVTGKGN